MLVMLRLMCYEQVQLWFINQVVGVPEFSWKCAQRKCFAHTLRDNEGPPVPGKGWVISSVIRASM